MLIFITVSALIYLYCLIYWERGYFVYNPNGQIFTNMQFNFTNILDTFMRYIAGLSGCICIVYLSKKIFNIQSSSILQYIGTKTLGIYIIHLFILQLMYYNQIVEIDNWFYLQIFLNTFFLIILSLALNYILEKWQFSREYMLGMIDKKT